MMNIMKAESAGAALVRKRWDKSTPAQRKAVAVKMNAALSKKERVARAKKAAAARWSKGAD